MDSSKTSVLIILIIALLAAAIATPLIMIWACNTLFGTTIAFGIAEWFASFIFISVINGHRAWRISSK